MEKEKMTERQKATLVICNPTKTRTERHTDIQDRQKDKLRPQLCIFLQVHKKRDKEQTDCNSVQFCC